MNTVYVSIALVVFWCAVTTTAMAGRIGLSSYLAQRLATNPWEAKVRLYRAPVEGCRIMRVTWQNTINKPANHPIY